MPQRARMALAGAGAGTLALVALWFAAFHVAVVRRVDRSVLLGFTSLQRPRVDALTEFVAGLCSPRQYVVLAAIPILVALGRRRPRPAAVMAVIVSGANLTTHLLKPLLAAPRPIGVHDLSINAASWPSGHATAAMTLVLCAVLAAPARRRPLVGAAMAAFAIAVCYSFLELHWHYPSDVLGGFLVASVWGLGGAAYLFAREPRTALAGEGNRAVSTEAALASVLRPLAAVVVVALAVLAVIALARPHAVLAFAGAHTVFVIGAAAIAACGLAIAGAASFALNRPR